MLANLKTMLLRPVENTAPEAADAIIFSQKKLARSVGIIAFFMPWVLYFGAMTGPFCTQSSISHYYFLPFWGSIFVALMGFIGIFMLSYRGHNRWDRLMARFGGVMALIVAIFPTSGRGCGSKTDYVARIFQRVGLPPEDENALFDAFHYEVMGLRFTSQDIHVAAAALLFLILTWFALISFRRDNGEGVSHMDGQSVASERKHRRNRIYLICGSVMLAAIAILAVYPDTSNGVKSPLPAVFLLEAIALMSFGLSWSIKGRLLPWLNDVLDKPLS